jgi:uncharacterized protein (TIGR01777 family)
MKIVIAGASGLIGSALIEHLELAGHQVLQLVRRTPQGQNQAIWDPANGQVDLAACAGAQVFINLGGAGVGDHRWTAAYKKLIRSSRMETTHTIVQAAIASKANLLINASAIGWYGETGSKWVDESAPAGDDFLADVVRDWEAATAAATTAGIRVVNLRTGLVAAPRGGAWAKMLPLFRLGLGGKMGNGRQYWSFISLRDVLRAIEFIISNESLKGPVNLTAPEPATNSQVTKALASTLGRPALFPVPAAALKLVLGEFSAEILGSKRVRPKALLDAGFVFTDADITSAMRYVANNSH